jgi:predicted ATP-grasp superfamily ATP-dependent carboligase
VEERKLVWVGNRESEIESCHEIFAYSISVYGSGVNNNISLINPNSERKFMPEERKSFIIEKMRELLNHNRHCRFLFYSNQTAHAILKMAPELGEFFLCMNNADVLRYLNSKAYTKMWFSHSLPVINFALLTKQEISYSCLKDTFHQDDSFVVQDDGSSGGIGTYLLTENNEETIAGKLSCSQLFVVSPYIKDSYAINFHVVISESQILIYPPSLQITEITEDQFIYKGADFIAASTDVPNEVKEQLRWYCLIIGKMLQRIHYRGICGLDFLVSNQAIYLMEVNPRFQASSLLLDLSLREQFGIGLIETHMMAFSNSITEKHCLAADGVTVPLSALSFYLYGDPCFYSYLYKQLQGYSDTFLMCSDQQNIYSALHGNYLYRVLFSTSLTTIHYDGQLLLHQNLQNPISVPYEGFLNFKAALLTQGLIISPKISENYRLKNATFDAADITINGNVINCPVKGRFVPLSPWSIDIYQGALTLSYLQSHIAEIDIDLQEQLSIQLTKNGRPIHKIGFRTTDRVRIRHAPLCRYKQINQGCAFCHVTVKTANPFPLEDIYEVIDHYIEEVPFRHFLIGGPTGEEQVEEQNILSIVQYIRSKSNKPICVMTVPPKDIAVLSVYKESGVTELAFNVEIFDRALAKQTMPGKGQIPLEQYEKAFIEGVRIFGKNGAIRSMLLIGLDKNASLLEGVRYLCNLGVSPMLSPFRPITNTALSMRIPPDVNMIVKTVNKAKEICDEHGVCLGPSCRHCQNNTLV